MNTFCQNYKNNFNNKKAEQKETCYLVKIINSNTKNTC